MKTKKVGILYICTGKYDVFWKDFYLSAEKYLLNEPGYEKHYFVFTDAHDLFASKANPRIHIFYQENLGWPDNTLMRFHIFLTQESELSSMDYLYFANANLEVKQSISAHEFLPQGEEKLVMCQHPGLFNKKNTKFTYERNPDSSAYISPGAGDYYVAGGLNGGITQNYLLMCKQLRDNIDRDKIKDIVAVWHDESHLNRYCSHLEHTDYRLLDPGYLYPEDWNIPFPCKILIREKSKIIDVDHIKNKKYSFLSKIYLLGRQIQCWFKK